ncbi:hypothetical protein [Paenibacillus validus]|uniref:hypothetical protein n=1 Tax=Paenibacillus validus TaxID=44253 RepID=UPI003D26C96D
MIQRHGEHIQPEITDKRERMKRLEVVNETDARFRRLLLDPVQQLVIVGGEQHGIEPSVLAEKLDRRLFQSSAAAHLQLYI